MTKLKNLIERIFTKKNIKIFLLLFIVVWFFVWASFAQSSWASTMTPVQKASYVLHILISILSWWRVVIATLAWKFMTNDFVYGTFLHLDKVLWNLWNIIKNFANFALWLILIFTIVKNLFTWAMWDKSPIQNAKDTVIHTFIAWILIQISRFLFAALLDLSIIATAAVWSLPSQFMANNSDFQNDMRQLISKSNTKLVVDFRNNGDIVDVLTGSNINSEDDVRKIVDTIMPSSDSLAWPLMFLWASVFNLYDLSDSSTNETWTDDWWDLFLSLWINSFVLLSFSLMLALVFVFNLFRVITLWIIIPITPFMVLLTVFKKWKGSDIKWFLGDVLDYKKVIKLIFKPVYMTLVLSIILNVMVLVRTLVKANGWTLDLNEQNNMVVSSTQSWSNYNSFLDVANVAKINMSLKESIVDLLVYFLWLALMVILMKSCVSWELTWIDFIDKRINTISNSIWWEKWKFWWLMWSIPIIPLGWWAKIWLSKVSEITDRATQERSLARLAWIDLRAQNDAIDAMLGWESFGVLSTSMSRDTWMAKAIEIWKAKWYRNGENMDDREPIFHRKRVEWNNYQKSRNNHKDCIDPSDITEIWKSGKTSESTTKEAGWGESTDKSSTQS